MARFEEHITSKAEAQKIERDKKTDKKSIKPEDKKKFIAYGIIGIIALCFVGYGVNDFSGDDTTAEVQEISTPEIEADKYNSKLEAIEQDGKPKATSVSLEDSYKKTDNREEVNSEAAKKLAEELKFLEEEEKKGTLVSSSGTSQNNSNNRNTSYSNIPRRSTPVYRNEPKQATANSYVPEVKSEEKQVLEPEPKKTTKTRSSSGFFSKSNADDIRNFETTDKAIYGCIHTNQTIQDGNRVKIRLTRTATIDGNTYPINTIIYGMASIKPNRLMINISTVNQNPTKLEIYDAEDSNPGIYVLTPNLNSELKKELKKETLEDKDLEKIPFSKTLLSFFKKKVKEERIELLNNYKLIIKVKKENEY
jgi:hypothetical protein